MPKRLRIAVETGVKGKRVVAVARDWPGLERGGKTEAEALERLLACVPRYAAVTELAGMEADFPGSKGVDVVERYPGTPSTDFWGISFGFSSHDKQTMTADELERELRLMQAAWAFFDGVRKRVSAEMQKGPRGGGRDRDHIVRHTFAAEREWARLLGLPTVPEALLTPKGLKAHREAYCRAIREHHAQGRTAGKMAKWPMRYLIRHTAYHSLDHAWEMEDKDMTPGRG